MSVHSPAGAKYTTADLIRMAQMEYFGQYSAVVGRALVKLSVLEVENREIKEKLAELTKNLAPKGLTINTI